MSQGEKVALSTARAAAEQFVALIRSSCTRVEIAGSIRRDKPMVADIEVVAMPRIETIDGGDLWGTPVEDDVLERVLGGLALDGVVQSRQVEVHRADGSVEHQVRLGSSYKALVFDGFPVDLFIVRDPAQWGVIFTIRTGPAEWSHRLVTDCQKLLRRVEGGYLYRSGQRWPCPEERDFFDGIGQPWVEPAERSVGRVAIRAEVTP